MFLDYGKARKSGSNSIYYLNIIFCDIICSLYDIDYLLLHTPKIVKYYNTAPVSIKPSELLRLSIPKQISKM